MIIRWISLAPSKVVKILYPDLQFCLYQVLCSHNGSPAAGRALASATPRASVFCFRSAAAQSTFQGVS